MMNWRVWTQGMVAREMLPVGMMGILWMRWLK